MMVVVDLDKFLLIVKRKITLLKILSALVLLVFAMFPVYAQEQSEKQIIPTDKGTIDVGFSTTPAHPNPGDQTKFKIDFINKNTMTIQQHIDYRISVSKGENQVFGIPITHTAEGAVTIPYEFQEGGKYQISVQVEGILFQPIPTETAVFSISVGASEKPKSGCLIATAAFGSELAPQVQLLREYRDNMVMTTLAGSSFLKMFNIVYYSFSPSIADAERNNLFLQESVRAIITPFLGILNVAKIVNFGSSELSVLTSGILGSSLIGAVYFWPAGLAAKSVREGKRPSVITSIIIVIAAFATTIISITTGDSHFMMATTIVLVLSFVWIGAIFSASAISKALRKVSTFL